MKKKLIIFLACLAGALILAGGITAYLDPFMVYHAPLEDYYYTLDNQRYQSPGIIAFYDYDAMIAGTSLTQNFSTNQMAELFGVTAIRVSLSGSTMYEAAQEVEQAVDSGHALQLVLRSLDLNHLIEEPDALRTDLGVYPEYLSNDNPFDDVKYLFNRDVMISYCIPMLAGRLAGEEGGATSMEEFNRMSTGETGAEAVLGGRTSFVLPEESALERLSDEEWAMTSENVQENIVRLAQENPDTTFLYFIAPYSAVWWGERYEDGQILRYMEAEELALEAMLGLDNIRIYGFSNEPELTSDLSQYADSIHYIAEINDWILERIAAEDAAYLLTKDTCAAFLETQKELWLGYDYDSILNLP